MAREGSPKAPAPVHPDLDLRDGFAEWMAANAAPLGTAVAVLLLGSAGYAVFSHQREEKAMEAAAAVAEARRAYLAAMGADPGSLEAPELANPEASVKIRGEHAQKLREVAEAHAGTAAAALAWLEAGELLDQNGDAAGSLADWQAGADAAGKTALGAALLMKAGQALESAGKHAEAAAEFEAAARVPGFPLKPFAQAAAGRCLDRSGQPQRALELLEAADASRVQGAVPEHLQIRLRELRAQLGAGSSVPAAAPGAAGP